MVVPGYKHGDRACGRLDIVCLIGALLALLNAGSFSPPRLSRLRWSSLQHCSAPSRHFGTPGSGRMRKSVEPMERDQIGVRMGPPQSSNHVLDLTAANLDVLIAADDEHRCTPGGRSATTTLGL
jgi:hypothetical protein